ncbi:MAG: UvrD-helicase domain-containing protein [Gallionella sp.]|nr:UvrD-helicase domain-containing protein [Gallionella sp.]MDD4946044.1 UvrD-helicase domain-containing protein [Gallionella sp.]MDD5612008.1 UvrD-helicase domain-containing protein [Gallionella sp.]
MDNHQALDPTRSVVVEACAGSGKTWLLVSRILRLLLAGVPPGEILAITFTRKAAQEMQERLRDWLHDLATQDDEFVREFLRQRAVDEADIERLMPRARGLYQQFLLARPGITLSTFHGWFMQILQRAPLNSGSAGGTQLVEQTAELWTEAWQIFLDELHARPDSDTARSMTTLFAELGLSGTQTLLRNFANKRSEWWAYSAGQGDAEAALDYALANLRDEFAVQADCDPLAQLLDSAHFTAAVRALAAGLNGLLKASAPQQKLAANLLVPLDGTLPHAAAFKVLWEVLYTQKNTPRAIKANKGQDENALAHWLEQVRGPMQAAYDAQQAQQIYHFNCHALRCGAALLATYQALKQRQQLLDFGDLEWRVCQLLNDSDHAEYLQYKLDSRYRHVLLDEFQDTNPLQWRILQSWFAASAAVESMPVVFVVGDPKQSIYRFRRADARLFDVVRGFLQDQYHAVHLKKNETRRNAPAVLEAVNGVFCDLPEFQGFERHHAHQQALPGYVEVLPLCDAPDTAEAPKQESGLRLRNPLLEACPDAEAGAREQEAREFAARVAALAGNWQVVDAKGVARAARYSDIMVLVRGRTHLRIYEHALRQAAVPFLTSRRGGLLDTLEASDIQSLLTFLITPFADLALAQTLRTPLFGCDDEDLMRLARDGESGSWWLRLKQSLAEQTASPALLRAHRLLQGWLLLADKLPVHDLLDRIYFEGDAQARYAAAVPEVMRATVLANLQAFLEIALNIDAGRYPSLPGFLRELSELRRADDNESPDEGRVIHAGDALRIYTVHEAKGLEAPIVWMLDANAKPPADRGNDVLVDWPTDAAGPAHFSLYADKESRGAVRAQYFAQEEALARREDLNLLYVAMTRAKQVLLVSGSGAPVEGGWHQRIAAAMGEAGAELPANPLAVGASASPAAASTVAVADVDARLCAPLPTGSRRPVASEAQRYGIWLHGLMEHLPAAPQLDDAQKDRLRRKLNIPTTQIDTLWQHALDLLAAPELRRFFDPSLHLASANEVAYVNGQGQLKRVDRLVEFDDEVWVLDYKTGATTAPQAHKAQLDEYRTAMQAIYPGKPVRCGLILSNGEWANGKLAEV